MSKVSRKIGFVTPWYGDQIPGGAEMETREVVKHLHAAGIRVEVLTTCVEKFSSDWNVDYHKPGYTVEAGIPIRRFRVRKRCTAEFDKVNLKLMNSLPVSEEEEKIFFQERINSPDLYDYINKNIDDYTLFIFIPYMFGTTYFGCQVCPEKSVLIPCLHDEPYAYMQVLKEVFPKVRGMVFNAEPERHLAETLYGVKGPAFHCIGIGIDYPQYGNAEQFRKKYQIIEPFILYAGRKEAGKRVDQLLNYFTEYKKKNPSSLKLVLIGNGQIDLHNDDVIDLGFVSRQDKHDAYSASSVFCNPSQFESFSLVIMESWLAAKPVLVNGACEVTTDFVKQSNGGLYYCNFAEFEKCLTYLLVHRNISIAMGLNGKQFVEKNFTWDVVARRYIDYFETLGE